MTSSKRTTPTAEELEIFHSLCSGNKDDLKIEMDTHGDDLVNFAWGRGIGCHLAEDCVQEVFVQCLATFSKYSTEILSGEMTHESLAVPERRLGYYYNCIKNWISGHRKKKKNFPCPTIENNPEAESALLKELGNGNPAIIAANNDLAGHLKNAIEALPEKDQEVLLLKCTGQMTFQEIADRLRKPMRTIRSRVRRALTKLAINLQHLRDEDP